MRPLSALVNRIKRRLQRVADGNAAPTQEYRHTLTDAPRADAQAYRALWNRAREVDYPLIDRYERSRGYAIDTQWFHSLALVTQVVIKESEICYQHGRLLYTALSDYIAGSSAPTVYIVETGTARGFSALCMAKALQDVSRDGSIVTFDVLPHTVSMYWNCIADAGGPRTRRELLAKYSDLTDRYLVFRQGDTKTALEKESLSRVHFAFLDGRHTYDYVMHEGGWVQKRQKRGDCIFFDDYTPELYPGVVRGVDELCGRFGYEKHVVAVSGNRGCVVARRT